MRWKKVALIIRTLGQLICVIGVGFRWMVRLSPQKGTTGLVIGYIRQSVTRLLPVSADADTDATAQTQTTDLKADLDSPERQRANILAIAAALGLSEPTVFEDSKGHKSGASIANRPGWAAVEELIKAGKVSVLILNDLSRAHRKGWRVGQLMDWLEHYHIRLILAAPGREIDLSTLMGKMFVMFIAMVDEYYVLDASLRQKDSVAMRRKQGKTVAMPPFGTVRKDGYLKRSQRGAWLLADGRHQAGIRTEPPEPDAIWRSYAECARRILKLYAYSGLGYERIAYRLSAEGWVFRNRHQQPRPIDRDDVRRVIADWPAYAGLVFVGRAKDRKAHDNLAWLASAPADRNVFPKALLQRVALVQEQRALNRRGDGSVVRAFPYPLVRLLYCAQCEQRAIERADPKLRKRLTGTKERYRHAEGILCTCQTRSLPMETVHAEVRDVLATLRFCAETLGVMRELARQMDAVQIVQQEDREAQRRVMLKRYRRRLLKVQGDYEDGKLERAQYEARSQDLEAKIAVLETHSLGTLDTPIALLLCIDPLSDLRQLWQIASDAERQILARLLFQDIVYDLDARRIITYHLKPWLIPLLDAVNVV